jgi:hypothetical protein
MYWYLNCDDFRTITWTLHSESPSLARVGILTFIICLLINLLLYPLPVNPDTCTCKQQSSYDVLVLKIFLSQFSQGSQSIMTQGLGPKIIEIGKIGVTGTKLFLLHTTRTYKVVT